MKKMMLMALLISLLLVSSAHAAPSGLIGAWVLAPEYITALRFLRCTARMAR